MSQEKLDLYRNKNPMTLEGIKSKIPKNSTVEEAKKIIYKYQFSREDSDLFMEKYGDNGKLSIDQAVQNLIKCIN